MFCCFGSQETVAMLQDGEEEELPDELENDCSGDDNGNDVTPHPHTPQPVT